MYAGRRDVSAGDRRRRARKGRNGRGGESIGTGTNVLVLSAADRTSPERCVAGEVNEESRSTISIVYGHRHTDFDRETEGRNADEQGNSFTGYVAVDPLLEITESKTRTEATETRARNGERSSVVETVVSSPRDLAGLWITISLYLEELTARGDRAAMCFDSLTALFESVPLDRAYRFVRVLLGRLRGANVTAHFHLDPNRCAPETVAGLRSLFDTTVPDAAESALSSRRRASAIAAIATPERRSIIEHLLETEGRATVRELAARLVAEDRVGDGIETVRLALYHDYLPRLAEAALVTFDARTEGVALAASEAQLEWLVGDVGDREGTRSTPGDR